ncbi:DNA polymerase Y family protein [Phaeobacter sp. HF9A]|uniref:Y-family DNA polymerase n=1 Tax=Phaeobacter sp. HF9A TaxID=2721561 RepID=UPI00143201EA|nr:DNA polymerase Y family protein [Phaeobacter sp. HF9A]NIZ13469.1 DNA polymerase Y family protein [Phaeobacter sp. HF9A]
MFEGIRKRIVCMWFPRLASDRFLRAQPVEGPFVVTLKANNADRIYCLNAAAEQSGLERGMSFADARAFCPTVISQPARLDLDARFLTTLRRWAMRYCPWVGYEDRDGLVLDITGAAHLWGGEAEMLADMRSRVARAGLALRLGLADTRGAAWAFAHYGQGDQALADLPVAALRLEEKTVTALQRLGLRSIGALSATARAPLARRFGPELMMRLDQALGHISEPTAPESEPPHYAARMSLPDPIGLADDVMGVASRLLSPLCDKLKAQEMGARRLCLTLRRVDQGSQQIELRLAAPMRDPHRILPLFERGVGEVDAGFGIDQIRLEAVVVEPLPVQQISSHHAGGGGRAPGQLDDLITRIGTRIGLENIQRFLPADSHIPERAFSIAPAAYSRPETGWTAPRPRPLRLFAPEPIAATGSKPPERFRWRRMRLTTGRASGPERIAPEWWLPDERWRSGVRDYWKLDTREGRRLWLFYTPQNPGWFVQGEFA